VRQQLNKHVYEFDNLVVGSSLKAARYSYERGYPILNNRLEDIPFFDFTDLESLGDKGLSTQITEDFQLEVPRISTRMLRDYFLSLLSLEGLNMFSDKVSAVRLGDDVLKVVTENSRVYKIKYNNLFLFDDKKIEGVQFTYAAPRPPHRVLDWYHLQSASKFDIEKITSQDGTIGEIHFTTSDKHWKSRRLVAVSHLTESEINDSNNLEIYTRYEILDMLKTAGIKGRKNGTNPETGEHYRLSVKIEFEGREIVESNSLLSRTVGNMRFNPDE
tara:strand:+ start:2550 stop:3368 length:819 start_codon:yes stop_codon:yes gene_type:complete